MVPFEEALREARKLKEHIDRFMETGKAYIFMSTLDEDTEGGDGPCVILKENGDAVNFLHYLSIMGDDEVLREESLKENN